MLRGLTTAIKDTVAACSEEQAGEERKELLSPKTFKEMQGLNKGISCDPE